jgi:hypothetical protein
MCATASQIQLDGVGTGHAASCRPCGVEGQHLRICREANPLAGWWVPSHKVDLPRSSCSCLFMLILSPCRCTSPSCRQLSRLQGCPLHLRVPTRKLHHQLQWRCCTLDLLLGSHSVQRREHLRSLGHTQGTKLKVGASSVFSLAVDTNSWHH